MSPRLVVPHPGLCASYAQALEEGLQVGAHGVTDPEHVDAIRVDPDGYIAELLAAKPALIELPNGELAERAPDTVLWWADGATVIGAAGLRHRLTPSLERAGGHIGYGVRPSRRGEGHATAILQAMRAYARKTLGLATVAVHVRSENLASIRVIEKNAGVLIDEGPYPYGPGLYRRYEVAC